MERCTDLKIRKKIIIKIQSLKNIIGKEFKNICNGKNNTGKICIEKNLLETSLSDFF